MLMAQHDSSNQVKEQAVAFLNSVVQHRSELRVVKDDLVPVVLDMALSELRIQHGKMTAGLKANYWNLLAQISDTWFVY